MLSFDFRLSLFFQMSPPRPPKMLKIAPQLAARWPFWLQLGPSWRHLGAILAHLGAILVDPSPAKIDQNRPRQFLVDFSSQGRPQELPDPLQTSIFQDLGTISDTFFIDFSKRIFIDSALKFTALRMYFLKFSSEAFLQKGPEGEGAAELARRASSIILYNIT